MSGKINLLGIIRVGNGPRCGSPGLSSCSTQIELKSYYPVYFRVNAANGLDLLFPEAPTANRVPPFHTNRVAQSTNRVSQSTDRVAHSSLLLA